MFKYFVADGKIYRTSLEKQRGNYFHLKEERLERNHWSEPVELGINEKGLTLEKALKEIYAFPIYYDSLSEARRAKQCIA